MKALPNLDQVESHFDKQLQEHGATPRGADWNGANRRTPASISC